MGLEVLGEDSALGLAVGSGLDPHRGVRGRDSDPISGDVAT